MSLEFKHTFEDSDGIFYNSTDNKVQIQFLTRGYIYISKKLANDPEKTISIMFKINTMNMLATFDDDINYIESISDMIRMSFNFTDENFIIKEVYDLLGLDLWYKNTSLETFLNERDSDPASPRLSPDPDDYYYRNNWNEQGLPYWEKWSGMIVNNGEGTNSDTSRSIREQIIDVENILRSRNFFKQLVEDSLSSIFSNPEFKEELREWYTD